MDKIHDKASKFFNDVRKKKIRVSKTIRKEHAKQDSCHITDVSCNCCLYCHKVFINSRFLIKHVMRRHSDDLVLLHKNCLKHESNNNSNDLQCLISFLEEEFLTLKSELMTVKQAVADRNNDTEAPEVEKNNELQGSIANICESDENTGTNIDSNEFKALKEKMCDIERNIQSFHGKVEELDDILKNKVLLKHDVSKHVVFNEQSMLKAQESQFIELRQILLCDLETLLFNQLHKNNSEWKSQLSELRHEIKRLDWIFDTVKKQIDSPESLKETEKRLEQHIIHFLGSTKNRSRKAKSSNYKTKLPGTKVQWQLQEKKKSKHEKFDKATDSSEKKEESETSFVLSNELSILVAEKLSQFSIAPNISKISCAEYDEKLKLINTEKEHLIKRYHNFSEIYNNINMYADYRVHSKLKNKKCRKIRFSEPLTSSGKVLPSSVTNNENYMHKISPLLQNENKQCTDAESQILSDTECREFDVFRKQRSFAPESQGFTFPDVGASGDCSWKFSNNQNNSVKCTKPSSVKEFKTSSPIWDIRACKEESVTFSKDCSIINPVSSSFNRILDCASPEIQQKSDCILKDHHLQNEETQFFKPFKQFGEAEDNHASEDDFDDKGSLESLSSWEDEDNPLECSVKRDL